MSTLNRLMEMEHEVGKSNSPPKLLKIEDYYWWKARFESFARFHDIKMWLCIEDGYSAPTQEVEGRNKVLTYQQMKEEDKKIFEAENRALSCIKMCMPQEILHTFRNHRSSKDLWESLEKRYEGNPQVRKGRMELLEQQFSIFKYMKNESLDDIITRFYHLLTELDSHGVEYKESKKADKLLDALPPKWEMYTALIKHDEEKFAKITLEETIGKLRAYNFKMQKKEMESDQVQNPGMYYGIPKTSASNA